MLLASLLLGRRLPVDEVGEELGVVVGLQLLESGEVSEGGVALAEGGAGAAGIVVCGRGVGGELEGAVGGGGGLVVSEQAVEGFGEPFVGVGVGGLARGG